MIEEKEFDRRLGLQMRQLRLRRGLSQKALADALQISFQQVQKYERGLNRISSARLWCIAHLLNVPIADILAGAVQPPAPEAGELPANYSAESIRLMHQFEAIDDKKTRRLIMELTALLGGACFGKKR